MKEEAPGTKERADGDVEGAVGDAAPVEGALEEAEGFGIGDDGGGACFAADAGEFARGAVVAEKSFQTIDLFEGEVHVLICRGFVGGVEVDGEDGAHGGVGLVKAL